MLHTVVFFCKLYSFGTATQLWQIKNNIFLELSPTFLELCFHFQVSSADVIAIIRGLQKIENLSDKSELTPQRHCQQHD